MNKHRICASLLFISCLCTVSAGEPVTGTTVKPRGGIVGFIKKVGTFIDSMSVRGVDPEYIESPKKPWQVIAQGSVSQTDLKMEAVIDGRQLFGDKYGDITLEPRIRTTPSSYVGLWAGYRGYGFGYSVNVGGDKGSILKFGATGGAYGVNLRIHNFESDMPSMRVSGLVDGTWEEDKEDYFLLTPIKVRTLILDGYYLFNGKRFSHTAAYDQSTIQKRSAGSFMAGMMYYHSHVNYAHDTDPDFILLMGDVGRAKQDQLSIGAGYAYNLVPAKGMLLSVLAMPMLSVYNNFRTWRYDSTMREYMIEHHTSPYSDTDEEADIASEIWFMGKDTYHGKPGLNFDSRVSFTYNAKNWFFNVHGQVNTFSYHHGTDKGRLYDWFVNASFGIRL